MYIILIHRNKISYCLNPKKKFRINVSKSFLINSIYEPCHIDSDYDKLPLL